LNERQQKFFVISYWKTTAMILDLNRDPIFRRHRAKPHGDRSRDGLFMGVAKAGFISSIAAKTLGEFIT